MIRGHAERIGGEMGGKAFLLWETILYESLRTEEGKMWERRIRFKGWGKNEERMTKGEVVI